MLLKFVHHKAGEDHLQNNRSIKYYFSLVYKAKKNCQLRQFFQVIKIRGKTPHRFPGRKPRQR